MAKSTSRSSGANPYNKRLLKRFNLALGTIYLITSLFTVGGVYWWVRAETYSTAETQLSLLVDMVKSLRKYVAEDLRPAMLEKQIFHPPAVSSTVATSRVASRFLAKQPGYYIKVASDNPLNNANRASRFESELLGRYRRNKGMEELVEIGEINGKHYLVSARPSKSKKGCLVCHGEPEAAPNVIRAAYGSTSGYHYVTGNVVGVSVVGVPIADINAVAAERSLIGIGLVTALFAGILIIINLLVRRNILQPIMQITEHAHAVSHGDLKRPLTVDRYDEIGALANSFELMRRSVLAMLKQVIKKKGSALNG